MCTLHILFGKTESKGYPSEAVSSIHALSFDVHWVRSITRAFVSDQERTSLTSEKVLPCPAWHVQ